MEINRRRIAVHAVIKQCRLTFYIYKQQWFVTLASELYTKKKDIKYKARVIYIKNDGSYLQHKVYIYRETKTTKFPPPEIFFTPMTKYRKSKTQVPTTHI